MKNDIIQELGITCEGVTIAAKNIDLSIPLLMVHSFHGSHQ
jgi:hypothetical protein